MLLPVVNDNPQAPGPFQGQAADTSLGRRRGAEADEEGDRAFGVQVHRLVPPRYGVVDPSAPHDVPSYDVDGGVRVRGLTPRCFGPRLIVRVNDNGVVVVFHLDAGPVAGDAGVAGNAPVGVVVHAV